MTPADLKAIAAELFRLMREEGLTHSGVSLAAPASADQTAARLIEARNLKASMKLQRGKK